MLKNRINSTQKLKRNEAYVGETLEEKLQRVTETKEPITDTAPIIFTERKDGILPGYNIRTDRWDIALDAMDKVAKSKLAKRENVGKTDTTPPDSLKGSDLGKSDINNN